MAENPTTLGFESAMCLQWTFYH